MALVLLPANLAPLCDLASTDATRYSMAGVEIKATTNNYDTPPQQGYVATATNGKYAAQIEGTMDDVALFPAVPGMPDGTFAGAELALIPASILKAALKSIKVKRYTKPILANVLANLGKDETALATYNGESGNVWRHRNIDGRFPDVGAVLKSVTDAKYDKITVKVVVNPLLLITLLKAAVAIGDKVTIEVRSSEMPVVFRASNDTQKFTGLLMPCIPK